MTRPQTIAIGIGAQASGTTWLAKYLSDHPQVHFPPYKEVHYFNRLEKLGLETLIENMRKRGGPAWQRWKDDFLERLLDQKHSGGFRRRLERQVSSGGKPHSAYLDFLEWQAQPHHRVMGEFTPAYATCSDKIFRQIMALGPDVRLIYIMRDPVAREWSSVRKFVLARKGRDHAVATETIRARGTALPALGAPGVRARTNYARTLEVLRREVPREKVLVLFYEDFFRSRDTRPVTDFLGIEPKDGEFELVSNPGIDVGFTPEMQSLLYARLKDQYTAVEYFMGYIPDEWRKTMKEAA